MIKYEYRIKKYYYSDEMEAELNDLAEEGWRVINVCLRHPDSTKYTYIVTLERQKTIKND
jgi:hypothetical protein